MRSSSRTVQIVLSIGVVWCVVCVNLINGYRTMRRVVMPSSLEPMRMRTLRRSVVARDVAHRISPAEEYLRSMFAERRSRELPSYAQVATVKKHPRLLDGMPMRRLPHSDLVISQIGIGSLTFGEQVQKDQAFAMLDLAVKEYGINFIDTSELFPGPYLESTAGRAQEIVGEWLSQQSRTLREQLVISAHICGPSEHITWCRRGREFDAFQDQEGTRVTPAEVSAALEATCRRLRVDYVDVLNLQWPARYVPMLGDPKYDSQLERESMTVTEQLEMMQSLIQSGRIRAFGLSNETPYGVGLISTTAKATGLPHPVSVQTPVSLMERTLAERDFAEACAPRNGNVALIAVSPLAGGALSGKYSTVGAVSADDCRLTKYIGFQHRYISREAQKLIRRFEEVSAKHDLPMFALALAWVYSRNFVTSVLVGATTKDQLLENILALNLTPLPEDIDDHFTRFCRDTPDPVRNVFGLTSAGFPVIPPEKMPWGVHDGSYVDPQLAALLRQVDPDCQL